MSDSPFIKIDRDEPLSHKVERQIREAIGQKIFLPDDKLPGELELTKKFGVSRTAIREALHILAGKGLVDIRRGSGVYVSELNMSNIVDPFYHLLDMKCGEASYLYLVRIRLFIEPEIARLAAIHRKEDDLKYWRKNFEIMKSRQKQPEKMINVDINFHRRIASATNNPVIPIIMEPIFQLLDKFISSTYKQSHAPDLAIKHHGKLLDCFERKDGDEAYNVMKSHLSTAEQHVIQYYESIGFLDYEK